MACHTRMFAVRSAHSVRMSVSGIDLAWNDQRRDNTCDWTKLPADLFLRQVASSSPDMVRHRVVSAGTLFLRHRRRPRPKDRRAHLSEKLARPFGSLGELSKRWRRRHHVIAFLCYPRLTKVSTNTDTRARAREGARLRDFQDVPLVVLAKDLTASLMRIRVDAVLAKSLASRMIRYLGLK